MILDANLLLYAYNLDAPQQRAASRWLIELIESGEPVGLPWVTIWAFLRISTNGRIWPNPLSAVQALAIVHEWVAHPAVVLLRPGPRHLQILEQMMVDYGAAGGLVSDAVLAALAAENGARIASTDRDFARFAGVKWVNPLSTG